MADLTDYEGGQDAFGSIVAGAILAFQTDSHEEGYEAFDRWLHENEIELPVGYQSYKEIQGWLDDGTIDPEGAEKDFQRFLSRQSHNDG